MGALVVASKYVDDSTLKNFYWAECTGIFIKHDIGVMERDFLSVLDYDLGVDEGGIMAHHTSLMGLKRRVGCVEVNAAVVKFGANMYWQEKAQETG